MEMWCLDDKGGKAGTGLGHLLEREHGSTPQSGVEAPRLFKKEPPQNVLFLLFWTRTARQNVYGHESSRLLVQREPSMTNNCWSSRAHKVS